MKCHRCQRAASPDWALCADCADRLLIRVDDRRAPDVYSNAELFRAELSPRTSRGGQPPPLLPTAGRPSASRRAWMSDGSERPISKPAVPRLRAAARTGR